MYSSIANDSFSYLLTLDDMRKNLPEETRPSWVKVTTITMISSFKREIDIKKLRSIFEEIGSYKLRRDGSNTEGFEWKLKPTTFYNQVTLSYHDNYSTKSVKVFPNGSIQVAGCCDLFDCKRVITQLVYIFKKFLNMDIDSISTDTFRVVMINSNFSLNYNINLMKVANWFEEYDDIFKVSFEPDRYSAVKIKFKPSEDMKEITCSIFSTGKIIITGAETLKEIAFAYNIINQHINENPEIRVSRTEETDVFDIYLGYRCAPLIKDLREKGFKSWMQTITNRQINF
jgi:TATA-box binding protein (TBP) (component of TFIID and TFIIIB)|tara:strand:+ start:2267 stop:3124 length:858 start_codon:yes stop_codon:yes gene_type:complete